jgi:flagellar biosynthesis chaperone FliJ
VKRYSFRLARVLRVRRLQEEILRAAYLEARALADQAHARAEAQAQELLRGRGELALMQSRSPLQPLRVIGQQDLLARLNAELETLRARARKLAAEAQQRADLAREGRARVQGLERLDERRRRLHKAEVERAELRLGDEVAARRFSSEPPAAGVAAGPLNREGSSRARSESDSSASLFGARVSP